MISNRWWWSKLNDRLVASVWIFAEIRHGSLGWFLNSIPTQKNGRHQKNVRLNLDHFSILMIQQLLTIFNFIFHLFHLLALAYSVILKKWKVIILLVFGFSNFLAREWEWVRSLIWGRDTETGRKLQFMLIELMILKNSEFSISTTDRIFQFHHLNFRQVNTGHSVPSFLHILPVQKITPSGSICTPGVAMGVGHQLYVTPGLLKWHRIPLVCVLWGWYTLFFNKNCGFRQIEPFLCPRFVSW